jgi:PST family polysaccharide transporter
MTAFVGMGVGVILTLDGKDLIRVLLGPQWDETGRIFAYFGPGVGVMLLYGTHSWLHLSSGRPDRWLRWAVLEFAVTVSFVGLALPWGPVGIAVAWSASFWVLTIPALSYAGKPIGLGVGTMLTVIWRYVAASLLAGAATFAVVRTFIGFASLSTPWQTFGRIIIVSLLFVAMYLIAVIQLHGGLEPLTRLTGVVRDMTGSRKAPAVVEAVPPAITSDSTELPSANAALEVAVAAESGEIN